MATRISTWLSSRRLRLGAFRRTFASTSSCLDAQNFTMPAMSPTMTEGNISSWKVKPGDSFSTGDVLLEIETDKATMDVEAQEDGIMAKIFQVDGTKGVQVGTRIAVLAEPGDDINALEIPPEDSQAPPRQETKKVESGAESLQSSSAAAPSKPSDPPKSASASTRNAPSGAGQNTKYPLYPAVTALIHENHIPESDVPKIPATGPGGRLLKGDVLSYLGRIQADYSSTQSKRIQHLAHLDLSNIRVLRPPEKQASTNLESSSSTVSPLPEIPSETSVTLPISLTEVLKIQRRIQDSLNVSIPLSTFLARAVDLANDDLPTPKNTQPSSTELFNAVLGLRSLHKTSRGAYVPQITALPHRPIAAAAAASALRGAKQTVRIASKDPGDIIDILTGGQANPTKTTQTKNNNAAGTPRESIAASALAAGAMNVFSVTVPTGEERRARTFLERVKTVLQVEPGRLVM